MVNNLNFQINIVGNCWKKTRVKCNWFCDCMSFTCNHKDMDQEGYKTMKILPVLYLVGRIINDLTLTDLTIVVDIKSSWCVVIGTSSEIK